MLMTLWFNKEHVLEDWNVSKRLDEVDKRLLNITSPHCISGIPRSIIKEFDHRKAEFRSFLLFYGVPCLWIVLPDEYFQLFILLVEATWLLVSAECLQKAGNVLQDFCLRIEASYGVRYETFNMHSHSAS